MEFFRLSKNSFAVYKYLKSNEEIVLEPMTSGGKLQKKIYYLF